MLGFAALPRSSFFPLSCPVRAIRSVSGEQEVGTSEISKGFRTLGLHGTPGLATIRVAPGYL